jgi:hypothetical protein
VIIVDSSVLIAALRDKTKRARRTLDARLAGETMAFTRITQFEVMRGCRDQRQWHRIARHLESHVLFGPTDGTWEEAARIVYDLARKGQTLKSSIDCVIAQIAIENDRLLLHNDSDFDLIASCRPLNAERIDILAQLT